jgi:hypothetical protein
MNGHNNNNHNLYKQQHYKMKGGTLSSSSSSPTIRFLRGTFVVLSLLCFLQLFQHEQHHQEEQQRPSTRGTTTTVIYVDSNGRPLDQKRVDPNAPRAFGSKTEPEETPPGIPKFVVDPLFQNEQDRIDTMTSVEERCARYGVSPLPVDQRNKRRLFFGSMLANENAEVLVAHALEVYNQYDLVALVESNTTHLATPRNLNYGPGSLAARTLTESELFGPKTRVRIEYWLEDEPDLKEMDREVEQRNLIWKIWLQEGMTRNDVGIMADLDEVVSRDFANALGVCDFPKLRNDDPHTTASCQTPKMGLSTMQFESSPLCIKENEWFHPDIILGDCILGVGDPTGRVTPGRNTKLSDGTPAGLRKGNWGKNDYKDYPADVLENKRFPLWDGRDIREINGNGDSLVNWADAKKLGMGQTSVYGAAYHFHNWFNDLSILRHKYATYGHGWSGANDRPLSKIQGDLDMLVRCSRGLGNEVSEDIGKLPNDGYPYYTKNRLLPQSDWVPPGSDGDNGNGNRFSLGGNRPIYFQNTTYVVERHALVQQLIRDDEAKFGSLYKQQQQQQQH